MRRPTWLYDTTTRAESGASASLMVATMDFAMMPTRLNFTPPDVDPPLPPTAMSRATTRNAPDDSAPVSWFVVMFWKPVVENAEMTMNPPRLSMAGRSEKFRLADSEAANTHVITASHSTMVRISRSRKNTATWPFHISECSTKLTEPSSMSIMSTTSMGNEW